MDYGGDLNFMSGLFIHPFNEGLMFAVMIGSRHYLQIFWSIIFSISIPMMNNFRFFQLSTEDIFHDVTMLPNISVINSKVDIPILNYSFMVLLKSSFIAFISTCKRTIFPIFFHLIWPDIKIPTAFKASHLYELFRSFFIWIAKLIDIFALVRTKPLNSFYPFGFKYNRTNFTFSFNHILSYHVDCDLTKPQEVVFLTVEK